MDGSRGTTGLAVALSLWAAGCVSGPWSGNQAPSDPSDRPPASTDSDESAARQQETMAAGDKQTQADATSDPAELQALMAEIKQSGTLDPADQEQLRQDLRQTDPANYKPVMALFRAALACRRQSPPASEPRGLSPRDGSAGINPAARDGIRKRKSPADEPGSRSGCKTLLASEQRTLVPAPSSAGINPAARVAVEDVPSPRDARVERASYAGPRESTWEEDLEATIRALEPQVARSPRTDEEIARHVHLRLLYLAAGRRDDALRPIPSVPASTQAFWTSELYGLEQWLNTERAADPADRAAEAKKSLDEAAASLGESAPLVVQRLAFCTDVQSFGCYTTFGKEEFAPGQEVLLYAEVENFRSEQTSKGFHTSLRSSYRIFDSRGQQVLEREFPVVEEHCRSRRRDFFIGYHLRMPRRISSGRHTLRLTIEDIKKGRIGQASIDFTIKTTKH